MVAGPEGTKLHYSKGGAVPKNECTQGTSGFTQQELLHFAFEAPVPVSGFVCDGRLGVFVCVGGGCCCVWCLGSFSCFLTPK